MPTSTYVALATITLSADTAVTFSSIPATYRDLVMVWNVSFTASTGLYIRLNGDSGANYSRVYAFGDGSGTASASDPGNQFNTLTTGGAASQNAIMTFMDYSATDKHKTVLRRHNQPTNYLLMDALRWANTAAINTIYCYSTAGTVSGTISLYGIEA